MGIERFKADARSIELLTRAQACWGAAAGFRSERERNKRFTYGDQWGDRVELDGVWMSEEDVIRSQGNIPLKNNLIRRLVRNVLGVFRGRWVSPRCESRDPAERCGAATMQQLLDYNMELNRMEEVYARSMEEFLISGMVVHKKWYGRKGTRVDCWTDTVSPEHFFADFGTRDFRAWDMELIGEIHDLTAARLCAQFGADEEECQWLTRLSEGGRCRVYEIWHRAHRFGYRCYDPASGRIFRVAAADYSQVEKENERRRHDGIAPIETKWSSWEEWHYMFCGPSGEVLSEGVSPYAHGSHPYIFKAYPFIDGEIHSFVGDIIDQQKLTNRLISMYDWILRASAKGVLLFPEGALPEGVTIDDIADEWGRFNGVIVFRPKAGMPLPQQVSSKATDIGITELLDIQMKMMEDISGVNGALQGKLDNGSMSGTLYDQQTRNSLSALADLLRSYDDFIREGVVKDASNIRQYYSERKICRIIGAAQPGISLLEESERFIENEEDFTLRKEDSN